MSQTKSSAERGKIVSRIYDTSYKWRILVLVAISELFAMTLWFSASAVSSDLATAWGLTSPEAAWLTNSVQLGFVAGAILSSIFTLSDTIRPHYLFAGSSFLGAVATACIATFVHSFVPAVLLRFLTGIAMAGVYPVGMKMMSEWFKLGRGLAIGVLVGSLTVGSAAPHLLRAFGGVGQPRLVLYGAAAIAGIGGFLILKYKQGPYQTEASPFDPTAIWRILRDRGTLLANIGYFGHMWELYAIWTWIPFYISASILAGDITNGSVISPLLSFGTIAIGGIGAWVAGSASDRFGRTTVTVISMAISGFSCLAAGAVFGKPLIVLIPFCLLWGFTIVADSAQFSACVTELAEASYVGTALTLQTAIGYITTIVSIQLVPIFESYLSWQWAFTPLAIGPAIGIVSMVFLRFLPESKNLSGGNK